MNQLHEARMKACLELLAEFARQFETGDLTVSDDAWMAEQLEQVYDHPFDQSESSRSLRTPLL